MTPIRDQHVARKLRSIEVPPPPADLAARIKAEIPRQVAMTPPAPPPPRVWYRRQRSWLAAASLIAALGAGWLALRQLPRQPAADEPEVAELASQPASPLPVLPAPVAAAPEPRERRLADEAPPAPRSMPAAAVSPAEEPVEPESLRTLGYLGPEVAPAPAVQPATVLQEEMEFVDPVMLSSETGQEGGTVTSFRPAAGTTAYDAVRRDLQAGRLPPPEAVQLEVLLHAASVGDLSRDELSRARQSRAKDGGGSFDLRVEGAPAPFGEDGRDYLLRIVLAAREDVTAAQLEADFDPQAVERFRRVGGEPGGDLAAGHPIVALYELRLRAGGTSSGPLATLRLRYGTPAGPVREQVRQVDSRDLAASWQEATPALRLTSLVAEWGEILQGGDRVRAERLPELLRRGQELAPLFAGDPGVAELLDLMARTAELWARR